MMPDKDKYPEFVPDQLLTSENLNDLFGWLDEQDRISRTNLLGIGIVCGFEVRPNAAGTSIVVSKGTGITSEGYLVACEERTYTQTLPFDAAKEHFYDKLLTPAHLKKFDLWELKQSAAVPGATALSQAFLNGNGVENDSKVVMLFLELLQEQNKNCNPESCDDKGITIRVNLRPLLVRKQDVDAFGLKAGVGPVQYNNDFATLAEMRMKRFDVAASSIVSAAGLLSAYKKILTGTFLSQVENKLSIAWAHFKTVIPGEFANANPFAQLAESFAFINDGSIKADQLRNLQYVYDHFCDLIAAYEEFRRTGMEVLGTCCPDAALFPRHLLLDRALPDASLLHSNYRHHFRYSPLFQKRDLLGKLRSLFRRLVLMVQRFKVPEVSGSTSNPDSFIRLTPSRLDASPISEKAIPYYYEAAQPLTGPLYKYWSYEKTQATDPRDNLSWHAGSYADKDFIQHPLAYDLEPYNFLRVEGHIGKTFSHVLLNIKKQVKENHLPIDVIGLCLGADASDTEISDPKQLLELQVQYEVLRTEVICCLKRQVGYWGRITPKRDFKYGKLELQNNLLNLFSKNLAVLNVGLMENAGVARMASQPLEERSLAGAPAATATLESPAMAETNFVQGLSRKGDLVNAILGKVEADNLVSDYYKFQEKGDFNLSKIPAPSAFLDEKSVAHFALQVLDEISELILLLQAENPLALDTEAVTAHGKALEKILDELLARVEKDIVNKRPFQKIKAYVGEAQHARVDTIAEAMPEIGEAQANTMVLLLLNLNENDKKTLVSQLQAQRGNTANQTALINLFYGRLDKDGMMVPANKEIVVVEDAFLKELRDRLKQFTCLCALSGFAKLRELMRKVIEELKKANLFANFVAKHPGIQHKAGVPFGGTFIVAYLRKGDKPTDAFDKIYSQVAQEFPDGMVVADFYLPYLSFSNHPPVVYQINEAEPIPDVVTLGLQPNPATGELRYHVGDGTAYAFSHVPNKGTLTNGTEANGVTTAGADNFLFTPAKVKTKLGNDFKVDLSFDYVKRGVVSEKVRVTVFNTPTAEIKGGKETTGEVPPGANITLKATTNHSDKFFWSMQDAAGVSKEVATTKDLTGFDLPKEGDFTFTLRTVQSETGAQAISNAITVKVRRNLEAPIKTCGNLLLLVEAFESLPAADPERYKAFESTVLAKLGIQPFFEKLKEVAAGTEAQQLELFKARIGNDGTISSALEAWMRALAEMILNEKLKVPRILPLMTYRILSDLLLYVSCLRKEDLGKVEEQVFADMLIHLRGRGRGKGFMELTTLTGADKAVLKGMRDEFEAEVKRNTLNNKVTPKPKYARVLKAVLAAF